MMVKVGLTGGIATGKSTVAAMLQEKGARLIDFDVLTRLAQAPGKDAWKAIVEHFGTAVLNADGTINRGRLGDLIFSDEKKRKTLNAIVHPILFAEWKDMIRDIAQHDPDAVVVTDIPLLFETGVSSYFDLIVLVYAQPSQQVERLMERNGYSTAEALKRLDSQLSIEDKICRADIVIDNGDSWDSTRRKIDELWEYLVSKKKRGGDKEGR
jgi:dephospho-CoA kinase